MNSRPVPARSLDQHSTVTLQLESMVYGGEALGRAAGHVVLVTGGIAGETVRVAITETRRNFARGQVVDVIEPSSDRIAPRCPHFGFEATSCGGCHWQHIDYAALLRFKRDSVREQLIRLGKIADPLVCDTLPSPQVWADRNHVQFSVMADGRPGFQAARTHRTVPIDECHIVQPEILAWLRANRHIGESTPRYLNIRVPTRALRSPHSEFHVRGVTLRVSTDSFFQVNTALIESLIDQVLTKLELQGKENVLDAYCGVGLFSRFIAPLADRVVGIESSRSAIEDACVNLAGFKQAEFHAGLVEAVLPALPERFDAAVLDPPRAGCGPRVIQALIERQIDRLVYVSCDPATLARDVRQLIEHGYRLIEVQPLDMFPHTYHIETVALLLRSDRAIL